MDFNFNPEDEAFRMEFREWLDANKQFAPNMGETAGGMAEGRGAFEQQQAWAKKMAEGRWLAPSWPEKYGGRGAGILQNIVYGEELARAGVPAPMIGMGISLFGPTLLHWGTEEQKQRFIPPIMKAEEIWCQGYRSPGRAPTWRRCRRVRSRTATTSSSTGRKCGPRSRSTPTGFSCWCGPIPMRRSIRASAT